MDRRQKARAECVCAYARGMRGEAEGADCGDESGAGGVEAAEGYRNKQMRCSSAVRK